MQLTLPASAESMAELDFSQLPVDHTYSVAFRLARAAVALPSMTIQPIGSSKFPAPYVPR